MSVVGEAFVSAIIGEVVKVGLKHLVGKYKGDGSIASELKALKKQLPSIKAVVEAAESGNIQVIGNNNLRDWLWMLKDALYEADDVLDELQYMNLEKQLGAGTVQETHHQDEHGYCSPLRVRALMKNSVSRLRYASNYCCGQILESDPMLKKLREVIENLHQVNSTPDLVNFSSLVEVAKTKQQQEEEKTIKVDRVTTATLTNKVVVGRDEQKEQIIQWLMQPEDDVRLLSIVGLGGMGKTTLAQFVLEDDRVKTIL